MDTTLTLNARLYVGSHVPRLPLNVVGPACDNPSDIGAALLLFRCKGSASNAKNAAIKHTVHGKCGRTRPIDIVPSLADIWHLHSI